MKTLPLPLDEHLKSCFDERISRYEIQLTQRWPNFTEYETPIYLGSFSWTFRADRLRLLASASAVDLGFGPQTPGEVVRDYLDWKFPSRLKATRDQQKEICRARAYPCMAQPGSYADMVYLDIRSAYWSILSILGWDVDYFPGKWIGVSSGVYDFPLQDNKAARSALVTAGLSSRSKLWTGSKLIWQATQNEHVNYGVWAVIQDVLHGVADDMLRVGAVYVHTDGYIIPSSEISTGIEIVRSWGLDARPKHAGDARIWGVGSYEIGDYRTRRTGIMPGDSFSISPVQKDWLRGKLFAWSDRVHKGIDRARGGR